MSVFVSLVHLWQQRSAAERRHRSDDLHPPAFQRGLSEHHLPLQELCGLQGPEEWQPEEGRDPEGLQRPGAQSRGQQPLQIHRGGGLLLSESPQPL